jgi:hypothetical protein
LIDGDDDGNNDEDDNDGDDDDVDDDGDDDDDDSTTLALTMDGSFLRIWLTSCSACVLRWSSKASTNSFSTGMNR